MIFSLTAKSVCELPADLGEGQSYTARWYFDTKDGRCRQFYYAGYAGNGNNFNSESECLSSCEERPKVEVQPTESTATRQPPSATQEEITQRPRGNQEHCRLDPDAGPCRVAEARFYYNSEVGTCDLFTYGGCDGNENNFRSQDDCENSCLSSQDTCTLPSFVGVCDNNETRWYFDAAKKRCSTFTYGGCNGNANNFASEEDCQSRCKATEADSSIELTDVSLKNYLLISFQNTFPNISSLVFLMTVKILLFHFHQTFEINCFTILFKSYLKNRQFVQILIILCCRDSVRMKNRCAHTPYQPETATKTF